MGLIDARPPREIVPPEARVQQGSRHNLNSKLVCGKPHNQTSRLVCSKAHNPTSRLVCSKAHHLEGEVAGVEEAVAVVDGHEEVGEHLDEGRQGYLTYKKTHPPRTLLQAYA